MLVANEISYIQEVDNKYKETAMIAKFAQFFFIVCDFKLCFLYCNKERTIWNCNEEELFKFQLQSILVFSTFALFLYDCFNTPIHRPNISINNIYWKLQQCFLNSLAKVSEVHVQPSSLFPPYKVFVRLSELFLSIGLRSGDREG